MKNRTAMVSYSGSNFDDKWTLCLHRWEDDNPLDVITVDVEDDRDPRRWEFSEIEGAFIELGIEIEIVEQDGGKFHGTEYH